MRVLFFDFETTHQEAAQAQIVEVGYLIADLERGVILDIYSSFIAPQNSVDAECYYLKTSGLTVSDLRTFGGAIDDVLGGLVRRMESVGFIAGHNSTSYDLPLLQRVLRDLPLPYDANADYIPRWLSGGADRIGKLPHLDTRCDFPALGSDKLAYKALDYGHIAYGAHRALFDCVSSYEIARRGNWREAVERARHPFITIEAESTFDQKDTVRAHGFYWDKPTWKKRIRECDWEAHAAQADSNGYKIQALQTSLGENQ